MCLVLAHFEECDFKVGKKISQCDLGLTILNLP